MFASVFCIIVGSSHILKWPSGGSSVISNHNLLFSLMQRNAVEFWWLGVEFWEAWKQKSGGFQVDHVSHTTCDLKADCGCKFFMFHKGKSTVRWKTDLLISLTACKCFVRIDRPLALANINARSC
jgi:hypothetical protein